MKARILSLILVLCLLLSSLASCQTADTPSPTGSGTSSGKPQQNAEARSDGDEMPETAWPTPDYSDFEMPGETDTLVLYTADLLTITMQTAVAIFQERYPDVRVEWQKLSPEEYETRVRAEIPAGKGPDLLYTNMTELPDVYKTMGTGLFEDLNPYLAADEEIVPEDFIRGIFDGALYQGKRYIVPVGHLPQILATSEELLAEIGVTAEDLNTYDGFLDACTGFHNLYPESSILADMGPHDNDTSAFSVLYTAAGFRMIDYENAAVSVDEQAFRKMVDVCRLFAGNDPCKLDYADGAYISYGAILKREGMFTNFISSALMLDSFQYGMKNGGETPVLLTPPSAEGGKSTMICTFGAIPKSAANKLNAWRMLKILLSDEVQGNAEAIVGMSPVRVSAVPLYVNYEYYEGFVVPNLCGLDALLLDFDRLSVRPPVLLQSVWDEMKPYIKGNKSFDDCYKKLLNVLEIYKDE
ncbi:MAG: carbohydrate ABC transporter substrate-binding protein [Clostridia bacterium]|nr:carbohydrate ABC transporter substrate-binding protein [Clostridia bacterium]